jgi:hypothetical protein
MSETTKNNTSKEAPKATRSNPGKKAEATRGKGPKVTKLPDGTIKEDY